MERVRWFRLAILLMPLGAAAQTTGFIPLNDLGTGTYQGYQGGLYPGGLNTPPAGHAAAALAASQGVIPRDAAGNPDPVNGKIAFVTFGMSNTNYESVVFERQEDQNVNRNARVVIVNGAVSGQDSTVLADPTSMYWTFVQDRLTALGLTSAQVQVAWLKEAKINPTGGFPLATQQLRDQWKAIVQNLHTFFPNMRICYNSSRIFAGYAAPTSINPEPYAYESGFAVKWLIEDQINGDPALNYDPGSGPVMAPLLLWGAYLWADGTNPRSDGLTWVQADYQSDFIHPSLSGQQKVADMLSAFVASDPSTAFYWPKQGGLRLVTVDVTDDAYVDEANPGTNYGSAQSLDFTGAAPVKNVYLKFDVSAVSGPAFFGKLEIRGTCCGLGADVGVVADTSWSEGTITFTSAPPIGAAFTTFAFNNRDGDHAAEVTSQVNADADGIVSFGLFTTQAAGSGFVSKEGGQPPRLTLAIPDTSVDVLVGRGLGAPNTNEVRVFTSGGGSTSVDFLAYAAGQWGVNVDDADAGASTAILTGPGPGAVYGPQVRAFQRDGTAVAKVNYYAYGTLKYGVNVAGGNVDGDAFQEIVTGAGPGVVFGPHVRGWNFDGAAISALPSFSFFAYGTLAYGVNVATGNLDADAFGEILTTPGPGPSFGAQVRAWNYDAVRITAISKVNFSGGGSHGARVGAGDVDADAFDEIVVAPGPGPANTARFQGFDYDGTAVLPLAGFDVTPFATLYGGRVGDGDVTGDGRADLICAAGTDPAADATVKGFSYVGGTLVQAQSFMTFAGALYGANPTGAPLGY